jgi:HPt (histidine-containing phosphotransfer) domain-containing protein
VTDDGPLDRPTYDALLKMVGGDQEFVDELVDTYLADAVDQLAGLDAAVAAGDVAALVRPAHSLKSSSLNVGALQLGEVARRLEEQGRDGRFDGAAVLVADARSRFEAVRVALLDRRAGNAAG